MKQFLALTAAASLLLGLPGAASAQTKTITLGAAVQLTGSLANTGRYYRDAYQLAVDAINEKGGVTLNGESYKLALDLLDNQSDVNLGVRQYVQLVTRDKVNFLLGPFSSNDALDDSSVAEKYEVPMVQGGGASSQIFARGYKYIFGTLPPADDYYRSTIEMLAKLDPKVQTVALVAADDSFDVSVAKGTRKLLAAAGLKLVVDETYRENSGDFSSILSLIKSRQPDAILWSGHEPEALNFIRQAKSLDANANDFYSFTVGVPTADFRAALGKDANYAFGMTPWLPVGASDRRLVRQRRRFRQALQAEIRLRSRLSRRVRGRRRRDLRQGDRGRRLARSQEGARRHRQGRFRQRLRPCEIRCQRPDRLAADRDPGPGRQADGRSTPRHFITKPLYPIPPWDKRG